MSLPSGAPRMKQEGITSFECHKHVEGISTELRATALINILQPTQLLADFEIPLCHTYYKN
jgi:hypothetical protein